jgi:uncharacterized protein (TIGR02594 family)
MRHWGAFWLVAGLAASLLALGATTPAEARRMPQGYQAGASAGDAARWDYGQEAWQGEIRDRPRRGASRRNAVRAQRIGRSNRQYRSRHVSRVERRQAVRANRAELARSGDRRMADQASGAWEGSDSSQDQRYPGQRYADQRNTGQRYGSDRRVASDRRLASSGSGGGSVVDEARRWLGTNPTNRRSLWCGAFMNFVLERTGHRGTGSDLARSFASVGQRVSGPQVGALAVMSRRGGGHVGVVSGVDASGNPIIISGNHRRTVAEAVYPRGRVYAYVIP